VQTISGIVSCIKSLQKCLYPYSQTYMTSALNRIESNHRYEAENGSHNIARYCIVLGIGRWKTGEIVSDGHNIRRRFETISFIHLPILTIRCSREYNMDTIAKSPPFITHHSINPSTNMVILSPKGPNKKDIAEILFSIETKVVLSIEQVRFRWSGTAF